MDVLMIQGKSADLPFWLHDVSDLFPVGKEFEGRVLSNMGYDRAIVLFRGVPVVAKTPRDIEEGSIIRVRVIQSGSLPVMKLLSQAPPEENKLLSILRTYMPVKQKTVSEWIGAFRRELDFARNWFYQEIKGDFPCERALDRIEHLLVDGDKSRPSPQQIRSFLLNSGLNYEAKIIRWFMDGFPKNRTHNDFFLEDTKGMLMKLEREVRNLQRLHSMGTEKMDGLLQRLFEGLRQIEHQQVMNAFSRPDEGCLALQIPVQFRDECTTFWIQLRPQKKKAKEDYGKNDIEMVFFLELRSLGKLRINAFLQSNSISCKIEADSDEVVAYIKPFLAELGENITLRGYQVKHLECVKKDIQESILDTSPRSILPSGFRIVDVVV